MKMAFVQHLIATGRIQEKHIEKLPKECFDRQYLGQLALLHGILNGPQIDQILNMQDSGSHLFGQIALQLGMINQSQLEVLLTGQAIRGCVELVEDLALHQLIDIPTGISAITEFMSQQDFVHQAAGEPN